MSEDQPLSHRERGRLGAVRRWGDGPPRIVRLDELEAPYRRMVVALVDAARKEAAPVSETSGTADAEVRRASVDSAA